MLESIQSKINFLIGQTEFKLKITKEIDEKEHERIISELTDLDIEWNTIKYNDMEELNKKLLLIKNHSALELQDLYFGVPIFRIDELIKPEIIERNCWIAGKSLYIPCDYKEFNKGNTGKGFAELQLNSNGKHKIDGNKYKLIRFITTKYGIQQRMQYLNKNFKKQKVTEIEIDQLLMPTKKEVKKFKQQNQETLF